MKMVLVFRGIAMLLFQTVLLVSCKSGVDGERFWSEITASGSGHSLLHLDRRARLARGTTAQDESLTTFFSPYISQPYVVGAWYFTAWSRTNPFHTAQSKSTLNRYDPWGVSVITFSTPRILAIRPANPSSVSMTRPISASWICTSSRPPAGA
jgi:hypothetical protein